MSRSNPSQNERHPATRRYEWKGGDGHLRWYNRETKENVTAPVPFTFILLDELATVGGYVKRRKTGLRSNEVRDTRAEPFVVKYQDTGEVLASGIWSEIKDRVTAQRGGFQVNCYCAFKDATGGLSIGIVKMSGCALRPWFDFLKKHRKEAYEKAIVMSAGARDTTGDVEFVPPVFSLKEVSPETQSVAVMLDKELQTFFNGYFKQPTATRASEPERSEAPPNESEPTDPEPEEAPPEDSDVPF